MSRIHILLGSLILLGACQPKTDRFTIEGEILDAEGKTLYLDQLDVNRITVADSVKLTADGKFHFTGQKPECFDFYRLRIGQQVITLAVDSTETINVRAQLATMQTGYQVEGSEDSRQLKEMIMQQMVLQQQISRAVKNAGPETGTLQNQVNEMVGNYKTQIKNQFILPDPSKPVAYYALFSTINGSYIFDSQNDRQDAKCFAAVATVLDVMKPDAIRTKHVKNVALKGMRATAPAKEVSDETLQMLSEMVSQSGLIDIALPDINEKIQKLSDLKGKVVLLDFTAYKSDFSAQYNLMLKGLYSKYHDQGFEIYQVSFDVDKHFWMTGADNNPWITVHDEDALQSRYIGSYRIETLPTAFLVNRENEIVERMASSDELDSKISALLRK